MAMTLTLTGTMPRPAGTGTLGTLRFRRWPGAALRRLWADLVTRPDCGAAAVDDVAPECFRFPPF
jgi:hypothetical protein